MHLGAGIDPDPAPDGALLDREGYDVVGTWISPLMIAAL
jgi:hypothetical protein